jgi:transposase
MERPMKVQEVILRAMAKRITWWQAAEIIGISDRSMRRWRERYEEFGYDGLFDRRRGRPSPKRVPVATVEQVLGLYREKYFDLNVRHFHEKLGEEHGIELSYSWVKAALQGAGLVRRGRKRATICSALCFFRAILGSFRTSFSNISPGTKFAGHVRCAPSVCCRSCQSCRSSKKVVPIHNRFSFGRL